MSHSPPEGISSVLFELRFAYCDLASKTNKDTYDQYDESSSGSSIAKLGIAPNIQLIEFIRWYQQFVGDCTTNFVAENEIKANYIVESENVSTTSLANKYTHSHKTLYMYICMPFCLQTVAA